MKAPTYSREKTLDKIASEVEKIAEKYPNLEPLSDEDLHERRMRIEGAFIKLSEKK